MKRNEKQPYKKHIYWLSEAQETGLREALAARNVRLRSARGIVCAPLDAFNQISSVAPQVWDGTCARQGSWYRNSAKKGLYLVVSSFELRRYEAHKVATLTQTNFVPPRLAEVKEKEALLQDVSSKRRIPQEWQRVEEKEKKIYLKWARRMGADVEDFDFLYLSHTANHANFINPRFFVRQDREIIPYSIDRTAHLCSSCVELFQILGEEFRRKLVSPCPGAAIFARLTPDRYLLVEKT